MRAAITRGLSCLTLITGLGLLSACSIIGQAKPNVFIDGSRATINCSTVVQATTCHITLLNDAQSQHDLQWSFSSGTPSGATLSPSSGTVKVGATQDITVTYPTSEPCPITVSLSLLRISSNTPASTEDVAWRCTTQP
jgi:hypothetical protein